MPPLGDLRNQAVTGVVPPQTDEAIIRDVWPSVTAFSGPANLARACYRTIILAPVAWVVLAPFKFQKLLGILPGLSGLAKRYRLTNRRLMICKGLRPVPDKEIALDEIQDVRLVSDANSQFFVSGTLEVVNTKGEVAMTLPGVPEAESVRQSIMQAAKAWGPVLHGSQL
jgi:hypothetical protein